MLGPRGEDDVEELKLRAVVDGPLLALALHAQLPKKEQMRVFEPTAEGTRLVVVATNVAESSITIPGVRYVVDTGRSRNRVYVSYVFTRMSIVSFVSLTDIRRKSLEHAALKCTQKCYVKLNSRFALEHRYRKISI